MGGKRLPESEPPPLRSPTVIHLSMIDRPPCRIHWPEMSCPPSTSAKLRPDLGVGITDRDSRAGDDIRTDLADAVSNSGSVDAGSTPFRDHLVDRIRANTVIASVPLIPYLRLHLITESSPLWFASEEEAERRGLTSPFWAFAWPGGQALARHVLDHPELVRGKRVLDFGAGSAIEGLAALRAGARSVLAADLDEMACVAAELNASLNDIDGLSTTSDNLVGTVPDVDVVLAGDVFYDPELAAIGLGWLRKLADSGITVLMGDPSRGFLDTSSLQLVAEYDATHDGELDPEEIRRTGVFRVRS